jgi:septum formation protein
MKPDMSGSLPDYEAGIVLASASPRRSQLLAGAGITFSVVPSDAPEDALPEETPQQHVKRLSLLKAREVARRPEVTGRWFIGSDTVVVRDQTILGKPADAREAAAMLRSLSGRCHCVVSGFAIIDRADGRETADAVTTVVRFRELTDREIQGYIATGEPFGKAGAYAIQGIGACLIPAIEGSYTNVVGLPLCEVIETLEQLGAVRLFDSIPPRSAHLESPS